MKNILIGAFLLFGISLVAQEVVVKPQLPQSHPRVLTTAEGKAETVKQISNEAWAKTVFDKLKQRTDVYANRDADFLSSRLRMYWKSHATDVFIQGEFYSNAGGEKAPVPTVMYNGARSNSTIYGRPKIEDITPFEEDPRGLYLPNNSQEGRPMEWASISKTGNQVAATNMDILNVARDEAFLYWITGEDKYALSAASVFDVYMKGIYYRNVPKDLNHGHQQTLVGMTSFEVIHEDALNALVPLYDFLYDYLKVNKPDQMAVYAGAFKKWADNIIDNGVPHNNWDLIQARFIMDIALVLEDNQTYTDGKGREYYIDKVLHATSIRQWGLAKLADYGFDPQTGIWAECPGYSMGVVGDYANFVNLFDRTLKRDLLVELPVVEKAVATLPQYLFPNRMIVGFGDTHPHTLSSVPFERMVQNAQVYGKKEQERKFTAMLKLFSPEYEKRAENPNSRGVSVNSFFTDQPLVLDASIAAGTIDDYVTPTFWAPNVSWFVQRNGMNPRHSLMISENASEGNHMHANGISMELYGKGYTLAPDAGIGLALYSGLDYLEYYGQFPSHNTVCVDGVSSYPIMKSNHSFELRSCYPAPEVKEGLYKGISYSNVYFREPESQADQTRLMSIVTTSPTTGYYVDIFRSRKVEKDDKMHDYFYHNLGQTMTLTAADGSDLNLQPTEELAFAGGHLYGYSYIYDKKSALTAKDLKAIFTMDMPDGDAIAMTMWQKGEPDREVYTALSPMCEGLSRVNDMPYSIKDQPMLTYVARQKGEAWTRPFVSIFEPSSKNEPSAIASVSYFDAKTTAEGFVGICVKNKSGRTDYIFSQSDATSSATYKDLSMTGTYALAGITSTSNRIFFLGNGTELKAGSVSINAAENTTVTLEQKEGKWFVSSSKDCLIRIDGKKYTITACRVRAL